MISVKEETLQLALQKTGLRELPKALLSDSQTVWVTAIVRVRKLTGIENYCLASNDGDGNVKITKDFGPAMVIKEILSIHPIETLDKRFKPDLRSDKAIIAFLVKNGYDEALITSMLDKKSHDTPESAKADRITVQTYVNKVAIGLSQRMLAEEKRCKNIGMINRIENE